MDPVEVSGCGFDPELFLKGESRPRMTRSEKRSQRRIFAQAMDQGEIIYHWSSEHQSNLRMIVRLSIQAYSLCGSNSW